LTLIDAVKYLSAVVLMELRAGAFSMSDRRLVERVEKAFEKAGRIVAPSRAVFAEVRSGADSHSELALGETRSRADVGQRGALPD
jgi:hypothetical protein